MAPHPTKPVHSLYKRMSVSKKAFQLCVLSMVLYRVRRYLLLNNNIERGRLESPRTVRRGECVW